jgi:MYXO-CTERM domain-containing protein
MVTVEIIGDPTPECDERFVLRLIHSGRTLDVVAVIKDDDGGAPDYVLPNQNLDGPLSVPGVPDASVAEVFQATGGGRSPAIRQRSGCAVAGTGAPGARWLLALGALILRLRRRRPV